MKVVDITNDIVNKYAQRKVASKRAKKIFESLMNITIVTLATASVTLVSSRRRLIYERE